MPGLSNTSLQKTLSQTFTKRELGAIKEEAIRTGSRHLATGGSLLQFFKKVGVDSSRGKQGAGRSFLIQTDRFL